MNADQIIHLAASMGFQLTPEALYLLTNTTYFELTGLFYEMGCMDPDVLVFDVSHVCDALGTVIIVDTQEVPA